MHGHPGQRIEGAEGLVQEQQVRLPDERPGQRGSLRFPTGQSQGPCTFQCGEADFLQGGAGGARGVFNPQPQRDVGQHLLPWQQTGVLEGHRYGPVHRHLPGNVPVKTGKGAQQGGFPLPTAAQESDELPWRDVEVQTT